MIEHLIFDFDGTISDSYPLFLRFYDEIAAARSIPLACDKDTLYRAIKQTAYEGYLASGFDRYFGYKEFCDLFHGLQWEHRMEFCAFPEAVKLLHDALADGKKNYLYTHSGPMVGDMLSNMGLSDCFTFLLDSSYGFPMKPAPDALQFLCRELHLPPERCAMIGDRPIDSAAGRNAGMLGCLWDADGLFPEEPEEIYVRRLSELPEELKKF